MRVAIVTGSRRGIGKGIAQKLSGEGYRVVTSGVSPEGDGTYIPCDIAAEADRRRLVEETLARFGRVDVLVNNAGVAPAVRADLLEMGEESFDRVLDVNLKGTFFLTQLVARRMIELKGRMEDYQPRIVNVSSVSAYAASTNRGEYCISKAGVSMVTKLFAARLAAEGIPVFEVRPGIILTDMTAGVRDKYQAMIDGGLLPQARFGTPEDVANCVYAACSGLLDYATGQVLNADGGFHIRRL
jgi:3-oxoacyl-[acyl-carrier protein] reductase